MRKEALSKEVLLCHTFLTSQAQSQNHLSFFLPLPVAQLQSTGRPGDSCSASAVLFSPTSPPHTSCPLPVSEIISLPLNCNNDSVFLHLTSPFLYSVARLISRKYNLRLCHFLG